MPFAIFISIHSINWLTTGPHSPQKNGSNEHRHRYIVETGLPLLSQILEVLLKMYLIFSTLSICITTHNLVREIKAFIKKKLTVLRASFISSI